jgi:hypothetical protein
VSALVYTKVFAITVDVRGKIMNNRVVTKKRLLVVFVMALTSISIIGISSGWARLSGSQAYSQKQDANDQIALRDALRRGGLREAAKLKGHYVGEFDAHWDFSQLDIELLTKNSAAVLIGTMTKKLGSRLTSEGQLIFTDYEVTVQERIKGEVATGARITVSLPGGRVEFEDGTSAELTTPSFEHMKTGGTYTLFLTESGTAPDGYTLTAGPQGLVEIVDNNTVKSHGRSTDPINAQSRGKNKDAFLQEVRKQAKNWPYPGKCCN